MNPKITPFFSMILYKSILKGPFDSELIGEFREIKADFEKELSSCGDDILSRISELIGTEWEEKDILLYVVPYKACELSIFAPMILKIGTDKKFNLYVLIHELLHRFIEFNSILLPFKEILSIKHNGDMAHAYVDLLTLNISESIFGIEKTRELRKKEIEIIRSRDMELSSSLVKELNKQIDLKNGTLISYLQKLKGKA